MVPQIVQALCIHGRMFPRLVIAHAFGVVIQSEAGIALFAREIKMAVRKESFYSQKIFNLIENFHGLLCEPIPIEK